MHPDVARPTRHGESLRCDRRRLPDLHPVHVHVITALALAAVAAERDRAGPAAVLDLASQANVLAGGRYGGAALPARLIVHIEDIARRRPEQSIHMPVAVQRRRGRPLRADVLVVAAVAVPVQIEGRQMADITALLVGRTVFDDVGFHAGRWW